MGKKLILLAVTIFTIITVSHAQSVRIVPQPESIDIKGGTPLELRSGEDLKVVFADAHPELMSVATIYAKDAEKLFGQKVIVEMTNTVAIKSTALGIDDRLGEEEYNLDINEHGIRIVGGSPAGVFYGLQTMKQLLVSNAIWRTEDVAKASFRLPAVSIKDKPSFGYRGAMLDVVRHFSDVHDVKKFIDMMAIHKLNTFHWHLTDDQGWRIQIKSHPALTDIGSVRKHTLIGHGGRPPFKYDGKPYAGCYTQEQIKEVVQYAGDRFITVIPEIEMPGHAAAALAAYPELGCTGGPYEVWPRWGVNDEVFCAGNDQVFEMLQDVLEEVIELFPSKIIHIGGDECPKRRWEACPKCQTRMKENNIPDEHHLQSYFIQRIEKWMNERGRTILGWNEILEGGLSKNAIVMSWQGQKGGIAAAKAGNYVVMAPSSHVYLDYYQTKAKSEEPLSIGGFLPLEKTYSLNPYEGLEPAEYKYILGVQGNIWREYIKDIDHTFYMVLPRLAAVAETGWANDRKDFEGFVERLGTLRLLYEIYGYNYGKHIWEGAGRLE